MFRLTPLCLVMACATAESPLPVTDPVTPPTSAPVASAPVAAPVPAPAGQAPVSVPADPAPAPVPAEPAPAPPAEPAPAPPTEAALPAAPAAPLPAAPAAPPPVLQLAVRVQVACVVPTGFVRCDFTSTFGSPDSVVTAGGVSTLYDHGILYRERFNGGLLDEWEEWSAYFAFERADGTRSASSQKFVWTWGWPSGPLAFLEARSTAQGPDAPTLGALTVTLVPE